MALRCSLDQPAFQFLETMRRKTGRTYTAQNHKTHCRHSIQIHVAAENTAWLAAVVLTANVPISISPSKLRTAVVVGSQDTDIAHNHLK